MFGGSFSELALIFLVALVVLGPTRMPGLVRTVGRWVGKARAMARDFQQQLENEVNLDELNRITSDIQATANKATSSPESSEKSAPAAEASDASAADSGYPYGPPPAESGPLPEDSPASSDDTYSHAHAAGEPPVREEPANPDADHKKDDTKT